MKANLVLFGAALVLALGVRAASQQPIFRARVEVVVVDVSVVDGDGRPVQGLQAGDFVVSIDGRPRRVASATFVAHAKPGAASQPAAAQPAAAVRPAFSSNEDITAPGRMILLLVDQENIRAGAGQYAMRAAARFVDQLQPADRVGLLAFPTGPRAEITADHRAVKDALGRIVGQQSAPLLSTSLSLSEAFAIDNGDSQALEQVVQRECAGETAQGLQACRAMAESDARTLATETRQRTRDSLRTLRQIVRNLAQLDGPKTLVLISESLVMGDTAANTGEVMGDISEIATAAAAARVSIYGIRLDTPLVDISQHAAPISAVHDRQMQAAGFESLVSASRGTLFTMIGTGETIFSRIALELSGYYLLGVEAEAADRDGKPHRIDVKVERKGIQVRGRAQFVAAAGTGAPESDDAAIARTFRSPFPVTEVPLRVATFSLRDPSSGKARLVVASDIDHDAKVPADMTVGFIVQDARGKIVASSVERRQLVPRSVPGPLAYLAAVAVEPGDYTLRLAVRDRAGRRGSVDHPVRIGLPSLGPLQASDMMIADERSGGATQWQPSVAGEVANGQLGTYFEVYSRDRNALERARVAIEVAEDEKAPALVTGEARAAASQSGRSTVSGRVDVDLLPPGTYLARATVSVEDRVLGQLVRPFVVAPSSPGSDAAPVHRTMPFSDAALRRFQPKEGLRPEILGPFLDRLAAPGASVPAAVQPALAEARQGAFDRLADTLPSGQQEVSVTFLRGLSLFARGDIERAANEFRAALRVASEFFPAAFYLGACYAAGGRDREAVGAWQTTLAGESDVAPAYAMLYEALVRLNAWEEARDIAREAATEWPDDMSFQRRLVGAYTMTGQEGEALAALRGYLEKRTDDQEALFLAMRLVMQARLRADRTAALAGIASAMPARSAAPVAPPTPAEGAAPAAPAAREREEFARYARLYAAASGPHQPLVKLWERYLTKQ
jgi:VWFA-related protein